MLFFEFPTSVGMNRQSGTLKNVLRRVPHKRGDEPLFGDDPLKALGSSPQAWG